MTSGVPVGRSPWGDQPSAPFSKSRSAAQAFSAASLSYACESGGHQPCCAPSYTSTVAVSEAWVNAALSVVFASGCFLSSLSAIATRKRASSSGWRGAGSPACR